MSIRNEMRQHAERARGGQPAIVFDEVATRKIAQHILQKVGDPKLFNTIAMKAARALVANQISRSEMDALLDRIEFGRTDKSIDHPGPYFVAGLKRLLQQAGVPWR